MNKLRLTKADHAREWLAKEIRIGNCHQGRHPAAPNRSWPDGSASAI